MRLRIVKGHELVQEVDVFHPLEQVKKALEGVLDGPGGAHDDDPEVVLASGEALRVFRAEVCLVLRADSEALAGTPIHQFPVREPGQPAIPDTRHVVQEAGKAVANRWREVLIEQQLRGHGGPSATECGSPRATARTPRRAGE
jgi:hypothetical protein